MQANELRISNAINLQGRPIKVNFSTLERILFSEMDKFKKYRNQYTPIELTGEILLKIKGIKQEGLTFRIGKYILWYYNGESYSFMLYNEKDDRPDDLKVYSIELTKVKYLHQLQNVFYSLENEELEINL